MLPPHLPPHPSNSIYGHQLYPSRSSSSGIHLISNNGSNNQKDCNNNIFHYPSTSQQHFLGGGPPLVYIDGLWHFMPQMFFPPQQQQHQQQQFYGGNFFMMHEPSPPPPQPFYFPPQPSLEDVFDYDNAIFLDEKDENDGPAVRYGRPGLRRLNASEITEKDLAFLKSKNKVLCNLDECTTTGSSSRENSLPSIRSSPTHSQFSPIFLSPLPPNLFPYHHQQQQQSPHVRQQQQNTRKPERGRKSIKASPIKKRPYRKSANLKSEHFAKIRPSRKQPPPLRISSSAINRAAYGGFVGFCSVLKVNPYHAGCTGRITSSKDMIGHTYFTCGNCGTRRRCLEESKSEMILEL